jgi:serine/threonine protein kinase
MAASRVATLVKPFFRANEQDRIGVSDGSQNDRVWSGRCPVASGGLGYLGAYRLTRKISTKSQTCQVLEGVRDSDGLKVAIKALKKSHATNKEEIATLKHEYHVGHRMKHPHVCHVYEYHVYRKTPHIVMEYAATSSMKDVIQNRRAQFAWQFPEIIQRAAEGLSYFHLRGWVHRDIKPDNFLLGDEGEVKLIDFSIAQKQKKGLTKLLFGKSKVQGTKSYIAPEQIRGQALDARADIYSFGCTVFELVTGRYPYTATSPNELLTKHLKASIPSLISADDNVTPQFNELISRMMAKRPADRPESMEHFLKELANMRVFHNRPRKPDPEPDDSQGSAHG